MYQNKNFNKALYQERRKQGVRGQTGYANVHQSAPLDEHGKPAGEAVPLGYRKPITKKPRSK